MMSNEEKDGWHYLAVTSKHKGDFHCLNCLHYFRAENKLKSHEKVCKKEFCGTFMPLKKENIVELNI